jgi:hypothetical protein
VFAGVQEKFRRLLEIYESLGCVLDLASPHRELIKEGRIIKKSARDEERRDERYVFLVRRFSALLIGVLSVD